MKNTGRYYNESDQGIVLSPKRITWSQKSFTEGELRRVLNVAIDVVPFAKIVGKSSLFWGLLITKKIKLIGQE
jgi:hypothetical protein